MSCSVDVETMIESLQQGFPAATCSGVASWQDADKRGEFHNPRDLSRALLDLQDYRDREERRASGIFVHYIDG